MARGRPPLPVGTYGAVAFLERGDRVRARVRFRDYDGRVRDVTRTAASKAAAERALKAALVDRRDVGGGDGLTRDSRVRALAAEWLGQVESSNRAKGTKARYAEIVEDFVSKGLGDLRLYELDVQAADRFLRGVTERHGASTAKTTRSVLSGMCSMAVRFRAMPSNPCRDVSPITVTRKKKVRALTPDEQRELVEKVAVNEDAARLDLVDLVDFMLGTGVRIGEACALRLPWVDLGAGTAEIAATVTQAGGLEERTKSDAGWRVLALPPHVVELVRRRIADPTVNTDVTVFPSPLGRVRDVSNTAADLRRVLDSAGFTWVTSHTFRKTVATRLDVAGLSARQIADHLGHAHPSMTLDVYMGRNVATSAAAEVLAK